MKSEEIREEIEKLCEKEMIAQYLEELHGWANQAKDIITNITDRIYDLEKEYPIQIPFGHFDEVGQGIGHNINDLIADIESKLEAL